VGSLGIYSETGCALLARVKFEGQRSIHHARVARRGDERCRDVHD